MAARFYADEIVRAKNLIRYYPNGGKIPEKIGRGGVIMERNAKEKSCEESSYEYSFRGQDVNAPLERSEPHGDEHGVKEVSFWRSVFSLDTLKGLVLFLPGALMLSLIGVVSTVIFADIFVYGRPYDKLPESMFEQLAMLTVVGLVAGLMTWVGIGSLKDRRHVALPASVFATGVLIGTIGTIVEALTGGVIGDFIEALADNNLIIYLLPLILVVPVLVRGWLDSRPADGLGNDKTSCH